MEEDIVYTVTDTLASKTVCRNGKVFEHRARMSGIHFKRTWSNRLLYEVS